MKKNIFRILLCQIALLGAFTSCQKEEFTDSIFDTTEKPLDPNSYTYKLDKFLYDNYLMTYNLEFMYKMEDIASPVDYNLVPASYGKACEMAALAKYLWFDVYDKLAGPDFLKLYGPRIIHLIGSPAYNPTSGTMILGLAEGGIKVTLFRLNDLDYKDVGSLNEMYFKTMHHEFAHILHQKKTYPKDFNLLSYKNYNPIGWQERDEKIALSLGFISKYAGSQTREDFVEVIANYIVKSDAWWAWAWDTAASGWKFDLDANGEPKWYYNEYGVRVYVYIKEFDAYGKPIDTDGVDGAAILKQKIEICKDWLLTKWNLDLDVIRNEVQTRQATIDMVELTKPFK